ncbi:hypothetical protein ACC716_34995, partial [Rhizobium johnstonii]|uniref:hypothetical protein n=1 Tax=Rhizobium johnstonii TaxID=3019933 RepID=UPI003F9A0B41
MWHKYFPTVSYQYKACKPSVAYMSPNKASQQPISYRANKLTGVVTLSFSGWKCQRLVDIQATQAAI